MVGAGPCRVGSWSQGNASWIACSARSGKRPAWKSSPYGTGLYSDPDYVLITYPNGDRVQFVSATFECQVVGGRLRADGEESLEVAYYRATDLPADLVCDHAIRIQDALDGAVAVR